VADVRVAGAFLVRDFRHEVSYKWSFVLTVGSVFFSVVLWYFLSRILGPGVQLSGIPAPPGGGGAADAYFAYSITGLAVLHFLYTALRSYAQKIRREQLFGTLEAVLVTRTGLMTVSLASALWDFVLAGFQFLLYLAFAVLIFGLEIHLAHLPAFLLVLALTVAAASGIGILAAALIIVFKQGNPITLFMGTASMLFGNVLFPPEVMPRWLEVLAYLLPPYHAVSALRATLVYGRPLVEVLPSLGVLALYAAVLLPLSVGAMRLAVRRAMRDGTLVSY